MEINDMVSNEKITSSNDQLTMFNQAAKVLLYFNF